MFALNFTNKALVSKSVDEVIVIGDAVTRMYLNAAYPYPAMLFLSFGQLLGCSRRVGLVVLRESPALDILFLIQSR